MFISAVISMRPALMMLAVFTLGACGRTNTIPEEAKVDKKPTKAPTAAAPPVIVAIEIIDPNENKTSKNAKRTIESSLGYGYQGFLGAARAPPRFQIYKYSQHDIPPYRSSGGVSTQNFHIQKSVSYDLPTQTVRYTNIRPSLSQYYTPGTTLYSTLEHGGRLAALSAHVPRRPQHPNTSPIPVIILRVHPDSLRHPGAALYPQLPRSNPYAAQLNAVDVQGLLSNYIENMLRKIKLKTDYPTQQQQQPPQQQQYLPPQTDPAAHYLSEGSPAVYQPTDYPQHQQEYQQPAVQQPSVYEQQNHVYQAEPQAAYPEPEYQQQTYVKYLPPAAEQYEQQYQQQQGYQEVQTHEQKGQEYSPATLLTHENYPDDTHTRVIFRTREGHVQTTTPPTAAHVPPTPTGSGVIKISVPDSSYRLSSVEVRTPETQYSYTPGPDASQLQAAYESAAQHQHQHQHQQQQQQQQQEQQEQGQQDQQGEQPQFYYIAPGGTNDYQTYQQQQQQQQQQQVEEPHYLPPQQQSQYVPQPQHQELVQYVTPRVVVQSRGQPQPPTPRSPAPHKRRSRSKKGGRRLVRPTVAVSTVKHVTEQPVE